MNRDSGVVPQLCPQNVMIAIVTLQPADDVDVAQESEQLVVWRKTLSRSLQSSVLRNCEHVWHHPVLHSHHGRCRESRQGSPPRCKWNRSCWTGTQRRVALLDPPQSNAPTPSTDGTIVVHIGEALNDVGGAFHARSGRQRALECSFGLLHRVVDLLSNRSSDQRTEIYHHDSSDPS